MLVVLEGLDGAGKSTQVRKLKEYLKGICPELEFIHFPRYDAPVYGDLISRFLRGAFGAIDSVHPQLVALLFAEDRHEAAPGMKRILSRGGVVLLDRYVYSNIAYQCAKIPDPEARETLRKWILDTEYGVFGLPEPDLNLFLDVPIGFVEKKLENARKGSDQFSTAPGTSMKRTSLSETGARDLSAAGFGSVLRIDCSDSAGTAPPDAIFAKIRTAVDAVWRGR